MSSPPVQDTHTAAHNIEVTLEGIRTRSASSSSSTSNGSSALCQKKGDASCLSPPEVSPTIVGATSALRRKQREKKSQLREDGREEDAAGRTARESSTSSRPPSPSKPSASHDAPSALRGYCVAVELQFQLEQDRAQRSTLTPRDVANLVLWSVPAPIPIIESPRIFFIRNKSQVRNTVVVYVNGWSYDEMMCTGVGLPRASGHADGGKTPQERGTPSHATSGAEDFPADTAKGAVMAMSTREGDPESPAHWNKELCRSMLSPVREGRCWARPRQGAGCAGGVQYCPLFIPSTRNELEQDLWWRNDSVRRPGSSSAASSPVSSRFGSKRSRGDGDGDEVDQHRASPTVADSRGVGGLFQRAVELHANHSGSGGAEGCAVGSPETTPTPTETSPAFISDAFQQHQHLWQDRSLLRKYALHLPEHAGALQQLGFTLAPPKEVTAAETADAGSAEGESEKKTTLSRDMGDGEGAGREVWVSFEAASPAATGDGAASSLPVVRVFAFDCEMVEVEGGESALARATLVDVVIGNVVLDMLVKPRQRVTDYRTRFSGIDAAMLEPVTTTLSDCQGALLRIIDADTFVVGHSLENDFKACRCIPNCYVLDTTWLFPHPAGLPYKNALRYLAQRYLQRRIQQGSHDSTIDALVSAELTQLKLLNGPSFGMRPRVSVLGLIAEAAGSASDVPSSVQVPEKRADEGLDVQIHLFDDATKLASLLPAPQRRNPPPAAHGDVSCETGVGEPQQPPSFLGRIDAVTVRHDEDGMRKAVRALQRRASQEARDAADGANGLETAPIRPSFSLFWIQLTENKVDVVCSSREASPPSAAVAAEQEIPTVQNVASVDDSSTPERYSAHTVTQFRTVHDTNRRVLRIIEACPDETLVIILTGRCEGAAGGNHLSRAQGACFAFVKDSSAPGPRAEELIKLAEDSSSTRPSPWLVGTALNGVPLQGKSELAVSDASHRVVDTAAIMENTPPACRQQ